jgi:hypothetical protein
MRSIMRSTMAGALLLAGCALLAPQTLDMAAVDGIVADALKAARAPAPEQKAALAAAQAAFEKNPAAANRLRLATLLAVLPPPLRDDARAAELLESLASTASPGYGRFAALLAGQISERQRLAREFERSARERERAEKERDKERDKREEALRQQIEAMQAIERGILEREEKLRRRPR